MMSLWDALRMNMMISYQELVRTFPNLIKSMRHDNKPSIDNYEQIEIERYMTNEEVGRLVINFMKRTNGEPLLIVFPEYDNGDENRN
ncbi:hypothetical protein ACFGJN_004828 [Escherichia coli]